MQEHMTFRSTASKALISAIFAAAAAILPTVSTAQGLFSAAITVNDSVITNFELEQRAQFVRLIGTPGDPFELARAALVEDRLKASAMDDVGISVSDEDIQLGMEELAARTNLSLEEFIAALAEAGVAEQTLRDYTSAGLGWREFIGAKYLSQARPSEEEIDRAMSGSGSGGVEVAISELIMPINQQNAAQVEEIANQVVNLRSFDAFSSAATQYSASPSRDEGGRVPWMALTRLPPALQEVVLALAPGEVTQPIALNGAVALFQMRGIRESAIGNPTYSAIEYVTYLVPDRDAAAKVAARADTCDDFYGIAQGQDPAVLEQVSLPPSQIPQHIAIELAKLDPGEISTALTRNEGQTQVVLMLCGRTAELAQDDSREAVANALTQQRLAALSSSHIEQLRAEAIIIFK